MAQYIKHYYVDAEGGSFCCETALPKYRRHPLAEYPGLDVKVWLSDSDGVDAMLAQLPDSTSVSDVAGHGGKKAVQVLTETEFNSVWTPYSEADALYEEARQAEEDGDEDLKVTKQDAGDAKRAEALTAFRAL